MSDSIVSRKEINPMKLFSLMRENKHLRAETKALRKRNRELVDLCREKDQFFDEMISDGLRHGSPLAAHHMAEKKVYLKGK